MHVFIIDDNSLHLKMCRILLEKLSHDVTTANSMADIKKRVDSVKSPEIALVDFRLEPGVTGVDVLNFLKPKWPATKFIALTADVGEKSYIDDSGFDGIIFKPVTESLLVDTLRKYV